MAVKGVTAKDVALLGLAAERAGQLGTACRLYQVAALMSPDTEDEEFIADATDILAGRSIAEAALSAGGGP